MRHLPPAVSRHIRGQVIRTVLRLLALGALVCGAAAQTRPDLSEAEARNVLDGIYKGDYRAAFVDKAPDLFLRHIPDDFQSTTIEGDRFDATALRAFFPRQFRTMIRTIEHQVSIDDLRVGADGTVSAVVTLFTLIEHRGAGERRYLVTTIGTYRDVWQNRGGTWFEVRGDQLHNQVTTEPRP